MKVDDELLRLRADLCKQLENVQRQNDKLMDALQGMRPGRLANRSLLVQARALLAAGTDAAVRSIWGDEK